MTAEITLSESRRLVELEKVIERGLSNFIEVGEALAEVRDSKLYKVEHETFEDYCQKKWGMARRTAYQFMDGAKAATNVRNCAQVEPAAESQARPLTKLETPAQQAEAWTAAVDASGGKPTAKHVEAAVEEVKARNTRPLTEYIPSPEVEARITEAEKDSKTLYSLKSYWRQAGKKDRSAFLEWAKNN